MSTRKKKPTRRDPISEVTLKNGVTRYRVIIDAGTHPDGRRRQVCKTFVTLDDAQEAVREIRAEVAHATFVARTPVTVEKYLTTWLAGLHDIKPTTLSSYRQILGVVMDAYGSMPLQALSKQHLDRLVKQRAEGGQRRGKDRSKGVSPRTNAYMLSVLAHALDDARNEQLVKVNAARLVKPPRDRRHKDTLQAWDAEQARIFLTHAADDRFAAGWRLSLYGMRRGEVLGLTWGDVDLDEGVVYVRQTRVVADGGVITSTPKNDKPRRVPIGAEVVADLRVMRLRQDMEAVERDGYNPLGLVIVTETGFPLHPDRYGLLFQRLAAAAGLPRIKLHGLRHTAASLMVAARIPLVTVAGMLGHDVNVLMNVYAHAYRGDVDDAAAFLSRTFTEQHV